LKTEKPNSGVSASLLFLSCDEEIKELHTSIKNMMRGKHFFCMNLCARCGKFIQGNMVKFAKEGDFMGKPLCRRCRMEVEKESRENYREGLSRQRSVGSYYPADVYRVKSNGE
jgi:hypothetical protein